MLYYCNMVRWAWLDWDLSGWLTTLLQCFDTVGWVIRPLKHRLRSDLNCVEWDVKPCSVSQSIDRSSNEVYLHCVTQADVDMRADRMIIMMSCNCNCRPRETYRYPRWNQSSMTVEYVCLVWTTVWVNPPEGTWHFFHFFRNGFEFLIDFLHTYYAFISTLDYKCLLFNYPRLWRSYATLSATTQFTWCAQNVRHRPKCMRSDVCVSRW